MNKIVEHSENDVSGPVRPSVGRFLCDGSFGGILVAYLLTLFAILMDPNPYNFLAIPYLPVAFFAGTIAGALMGIVLWLSEYLVKRKLGFIARVFIGTTVFSLAGASLTIAFEGIGDGRQLAAYFVPGSFVGLLLTVPVALVAAARVNPWLLIVRGAGTRTGEAEAPVLVTGVALRLGSMCGLVVSVFSFACVWPLLTSEDTALFVLVMLYFAVTACTALASPRRPIAFIVGLLTNAHLLVVMLRPADDTRLLALITLVYGVLWAAFVVGQHSASKQVITSLPNRHHPFECIPRGGLCD